MDRDIQPFCNLRPRQKNAIIVMHVNTPCPQTIGFSLSDGFLFVRKALSQATFRLNISTVQQAYTPFQLWASFSRPHTDISASDALPTDLPVPVVTVQRSGAGVLSWFRTIFFTSS
jgi:hypothetical protein